MCVLLFVGYWALFTAATVRRGVMVLQLIRAEASVNAVYLAWVDFAASVVVLASSMALFALVAAVLVQS